jgi:hypothetical protein
MIASAIIMLLPGCASVHQPDRDLQATIANEGTIVFVRPDTYAVIGTYSLSDYVEVIYEQVDFNPAGFLEVRVGLRNKGGKHIYDFSAPNYNLSAKTLFYKEPIRGGQRSAPIYETNWRTIRMLRGAITDFKVVCPIKGAKYYQILLSERVG